MDEEYKLVGRTDLLSQYQDAWRQGSRIFGFYGMTKGGKTRLCSEFIKILKDFDESKIIETVFDFKDADLETYEDFEALLFLQFEIKDQTRSSIGREQIAKYAKNNTDKKFVFVFESLEEAMHHVHKDGSEPNQFDESLWDKIYQNIVQKFLCGTDNIYFCLTSCTWAKFAQFSRKSFLQKIPPLTVEESVMLLKQVVAGKVDDESCLETIAELCDGLPGSIVNAGADMIQSSELSNEDIVCILIERKLQALSGEFLPAQSRLADSVHSLVRKISPDRLDNLKVIAATPGMSMTVGAQAFDYEKEALFKFDVLIPLKYRSLVDADKKSKDISVHPITMEFMKIHHASTTTKSEAIAKKVQKLINDYYDKLERVEEQSMEYISELKDYRNQGFPDNFVPVVPNIPMALPDSGAPSLESNQSLDSITDNTFSMNVFRRGSATPKLNDLSPATSTDREDKAGFPFQTNDNLHKSIEQKPSLIKNIMGSSISDEQSNKDADIGQEEIRQQRLVNMRMNLGCSIEENDRITITPERRLSEIVKRNNLSRSASAQEYTDPKSSNLSRAMTIQESIALQMKRSTLNRSNAVEVSDVKWDDCSGSSQNITSGEGSSQSSNLSSDSRNSSCERNDTVSLEDNINEPLQGAACDNSNDFNSSHANESSDSITALKSIGSPIVRPKTTIYRPPPKDDSDNSLKRLLFGQLSSRSQDSYCSGRNYKQPVENSCSFNEHLEATENSCSFGPSLDPKSFCKDHIKGESISKGLSGSSLNFDSLCDCEKLKLDSANSEQKFHSESTDLPKFSMLSLLTKSSQSCDLSSLNQAAAAPPRSSSQQTDKIPNRAEQLKLLLQKKSVNNLK